VPPSVAGLALYSSQILILAADVTSGRGDGWVGMRPGLTEGHVVRVSQAWYCAVAIGVAVLAASSAYPTAAAEASPLAHAVPAQRLPAKTITLHGNLAASMPAAAISPADGLPATLLDGRSYRLTVHVGVAGGEPTTDAEVLLSGADRSVCLTERLPSGAISALHCTFVTDAMGRLGLVVKVLVRVADGGQVVATFDHLVVKTVSPE
jgi:hypothetical protein